MSKVGDVQVFMGMFTSHLLLLNDVTQIILQLPI